MIEIEIGWKLMIAIIVSVLFIVGFLAGKDKRKTWPNRED